MNLEETGKILAKIALLENRRSPDGVIVAWAEILEDVTYQEVQEALIRHYQNSTESIKPAHLYRGAKEIRMERQKQVFDGTESL